MAFRTIVISTHSKIEYSLEYSIFRPFVDAIVSKCYKENKLKKDNVLEIFNSQITIDGTNQTLVNAINIYVSSVISVLNCANNSKLKFPSYDGL